MSKILVVDDEYAFADFAKLLLESLGHTVVICLEGAKAVDMAAIHKPDLVITDMMMPDMNGLDVIARLKARPDTKTIPVLLASSSTNRDGRAEAARLGAVYSIVKPLQKDMLETILNHVFSQKRPPAVPGS